MTTVGSLESVDRFEESDTLRNSLSKALPHAITAGGIAAFLLIWYLAHLAIGRFLPSPLAVAQAGWEHLWSSRYFNGLGLPEGGYWPHLLSTTITVLLGTTLGTIIGLATGLLSARYEYVHQALRPIVATLGTIPILVAAPFFLIWFGVSENAKIALVCIYSAVLLHVYAFRAVGHVNPAYIEYARTLGASMSMTFTRVIMPAAVPELFGGLRIALGAGWGLAAITELLGSDRGIGRIIISTWMVQDPTTMLAGLILLSFIAVLADALLMALRRRTTRWLDKFENA